MRLNVPLFLADRGERETKLLLSSVVIGNSQGVQAMTLGEREGSAVATWGQPGRRGIRPEDLPGPGRKGSRLYRLLRLLIGGSKHHAFLDWRWIGWLMACTPRRLRSPLALRLLSFSPHYWIYQWTGLYPPQCPFGEVLRLEYERNVASRRQFCDKLLRQYLRPDMTVLDFGCGPGFLAKAASPYVRRLIATDVSRGVIACARQLSAAPNISYLANRLANLSVIGDASIDLVYAVAVFQHLRKEQSQAFFQEFARILRPGGVGICHLPLREPHEQRKDDRPSWGWMYRRVMPRTLFFTPDEITAMLRTAGFHQVEIIPVAMVVDFVDDICDEHLIVFRH
jgi:ubiquinone/menaquinone biosynthesis C-methylase UbiE